MSLTPAARVVVPIVQLWTVPSDTPAEVRCFRRRVTSTSLATASYSSSSERRFTSWVGPSTSERERERESDVERARPISSVWSERPPYERDVPSSNLGSATSTLLSADVAQW